MAVSQTARLLAELVLQDSFSGTATKGQAALTGLERAASRTGGGFNILQSGMGVARKAASGFEGAMSHLGGRISGLLSGPLGIIGLGAGILSIGGAVEASLKKASDFSLSLEKLTALTGESAQSMGELLLVTEKYGISNEQLGTIVGFTEKTLGKLTETTTKGAVSQKQLAAAHDTVTKANERLTVAELALQGLEGKAHVSASQLAAARFKVRDATVALSTAETDLAAKSTQFAVTSDKLSAIQKEFGVQLEDSKGHALSFSQVLNNVADYYNSSATASQKADLAARIFGRGYAAMIPILQLGSKGINDSKKAVEDLGLSLGTDTQGALEAYKTALRQVGEAIDVLQIGIGL